MKIINLIRIKLIKHIEKLEKRCTFLIRACCDNPEKLKRILTTVKRLNKIGTGINIVYFCVIPGILSSAKLNRMSKNVYSKANNFCCAKNFYAGFIEGEKEMVEKYMQKRGKVMVLAGGNGREAVYFAKKGWDVTCVDYITKNIKEGIRLAEQEKLRIEFIEGDVLELGSTVGRRLFDYILFSCYTIIPGRQTRINILKTLSGMLSPAGKLLLSFPCYEEFLHPGENKEAFKIFILLSKFFERINKSFETGDIYNGVIYKHLYRDRMEICNEVLKGGFRVVDSCYGKYVLEHNY